MDFPHDTGYFKLAAIAERLPLPVYVTEAPLTSGPVPSSTYADPVQRLFPCHDKCATWLSAAYFADAKDTLPPARREKIAANIRKFAAFWDITKDVDAAMVETEKVAATVNDDDYAYVWKSAAGHVVRRLPVRSPSEVKTAAEWLNTHREALPYPSRQTIATRLLTKAARFNTVLSRELSDFLERQAGIGRAEINGIAETCRGMGDLAHATQPEVAKAAYALADAVTGSPDFLLSEDKVASLVEAMYAIRDDIRQAYPGASIPFPEDSVYGLTTTKLATLAEAVVDWPTGDVYTWRSLERIPRTAVQALLGEDFAKQACGAFYTDPERLATAAGKLDGDELSALKECLSQYSATPVHRNPLSVDDLHRLAGVA